ncbi:hypothetical protein JCM11491_006059 [Sporobolomyces phaffii]
MASTHLASQLTRLALPLIEQHGFTRETLVLASASLNGASTPLSPRTIDALYPSPPLTIPSPSAFSLKGLAIGNGGKRSLSRTELIALARGDGIVPGSGLAHLEKTGPARALFNAWLEQGRSDMVDTVRQSRLRGDDALRRGVRARLEYNLPVLDTLPQALALLSAPTTTPLSDPAAILPSPLPHLAHVAAIAQDLAKASGSQAQGTAWYSIRTRLSLIYTLSELHLLSSPSPSPSPSPSSSPTTTPTTLTSTLTTREERIASATRYAETLFDETARVGDSVEGVRAFANWVVKSWMGIGRSLGV